MHNAAFESLGIDARYRALEVPPGGLARVVADFRSSPTFLGANVTVPHKRSVIDLLDAVTAEAQSIGAVNTIAREGDRLIGSNTDAAGFSRALAELSPGAQGAPRTVGAAGRGGRALVLGAGGSARAVVWALLQGGSAEHSGYGRGEGGLRIGVHARRHEAALQLVRALGGGEAVAARDDVAEWLSDCAVLVNSTPVGMVGGGAPDANPAPGPLTSLPGGAVVMDLVYRPAVTPLLSEASRCGLANANGLSMLVWQGAASFETWTGERAPADVMRRAALAAMEG